MSQERINRNSDVSTDSTATSYVQPDVSIIDRSKNKSGKTRVVYGVHEEYFNITGKTVSSVRKSLREVYNLPNDVGAKVDGKEVGDDFIIQEDTVLEFQKEAGSKG